MGATERLLMWLFYSGRDREVVDVVVPRWP